LLCLDAHACAPELATGVFAHDPNFVRAARPGDEFKQVLENLPFTDLLYHTSTRTRARKRVDLSTSRHAFLFLHEQSSQAQRERLLLSIETTVTSLGLQPVSFSSKRLQRICDSSFFFFGFAKRQKHNSYIQERTRTPLSQQ